MYGDRMDKDQFEDHFLFLFAKLNFPQVHSVIHTCFTPRKLKMESMKLHFPSNSKCHSYMFYTPKTQNGTNETQLPSSSKCHSYMFYTPKTQNGMNGTPLPFELKVSFIHVLQPENSKWNE